MFLVPFDQHQRMVSAFTVPWCPSVWRQRLLASRKTVEVFVTQHGCDFAPPDRSYPRRWSHRT